METFWQFVGLETVTLTLGALAGVAYNRLVDRLESGMLGAVVSSLVVGGVVATLTLSLPALVFLLHTVRLPAPGMALLVVAQIAAVFAATGTPMVVGSLRRWWPLYRRWMEYRRAK